MSLKCMPEITITQRYQLESNFYVPRRGDLEAIARVWVYTRGFPFKISEEGIGSRCEHVIAMEKPPAKLSLSTDGHINFAEVRRGSAPIFNYLTLENSVARTWETLKAIMKQTKTPIQGDVGRIYLFGDKVSVEHTYRLLLKREKQLSARVRRIVPTDLEISPTPGGNPHRVQKDIYGALVLTVFEDLHFERMLRRTG